MIIIPEQKIRLATSGILFCVSPESEQCRCECARYIHMCNRTWASRGCNWPTPFSRPRRRNKIILLQRFIDRGERLTLMVVCQQRKRDRAGTAHQVYICIAPRRALEKLLFRRDRPTGHIIPLFISPAHSGRSALTPSADCNFICGRCDQWNIAAGA